ncbi:hypothetical protein M440DRAFT_1403263 [Trichoderma longibrachiatum ATCC 18648]|uniref:Uncharacterized protein n=1 Tax=Trichoderma longibrachiatum ATCC 18648 TaxID=983965 RepID=A0A2T4BZS7_TRILO|nr:hypothetical protein M440DRAFT_1403263 [Trichoderma longibrachiatum ATCC 18648]
MGRPRHGKASSIAEPVRFPTPASRRRAGGWSERLVPVVCLSFTLPVRVVTWKMPPQRSGFSVLSWNGIRGRETVVEIKGWT